MTHHQEIKRNVGCKYFCDGGGVLRQTGGEERDGGCCQATRHQSLRVDRQRGVGWSPVRGGRSRGGGGRGHHNLASAQATGGIRRTLQVPHPGEQRTQQPLVLGILGRALQLQTARLLRDALQPEVPQVVRGDRRAAHLGGERLPADAGPAFRARCRLRLRPRPLQRAAQLVRGQPGLCDAMRVMDGRMLKEAMEKVHFKDESEKTFRFLPSGDAPPRYSIINFQKKSDSSDYLWRPVGTYALSEMGVPHLDLDKNALRFKHLEMEFPRSFCSAPCHLGQAKLQLEGDTCCWLCTNCSAYQFLPDQFRCEDCPPGTLPAHPHKARCDPIPEAYLSYSSPWALGTMAFAGLGALTTLAVAGQFWKFRDTPVIKASGRELSGLLLLGIFLSFTMTFVIVAKPAPCTCGITRFFLGFCYTLCYAAIVTKTNRIARIFNQRRQKPCQKPRYTSPKSQLVITALLVSIEGIINTTWLLYDRPAVTHMYPTREENVLICLGSDTASYLVGLIYPFVLIGFCTVYAFKTRKCPDGFNEARYLTFTNYDVRDLAGVPAAVRAEHQQHHPLRDSEFAAQPERDGAAGMPLLPQGVHRRLQAGEEHQGRRHVPAQPQLLLPRPAPALYPPNVLNGASTVAKIITATACALSPPLLQCAVPESTIRITTYATRKQWTTTRTRVRQGKTTSPWKRSQHASIRPTPILSNT
ncbi:metabotropic glutamate receptor 3 [Caerostris extrusa]|uniref:Metabotropic glutamate receptor 3 n=1 Tax=Caerostris extrusa TaxID=172846 RepID=A0AAV4MQV0_CAEEX|nr:metabotropic glutamate receptor 3 [Caerostris extrusa]